MRSLIPHLSSLTRVSWSKMVLWLLYNSRLRETVQRRKCLLKLILLYPKCSNRGTTPLQVHFQVESFLVLTWGRSVWLFPKCFNRGNTARTSHSSWIILVTDLTSGKYPLSRIYQILLIPLVSHNKDLFVSSKIDVCLWPLCSCRFTEKNNSLYFSCCNHEEWHSFFFILDSISY